MNRRSTLWPKLASTLVLTVAAAVVWAFVLAWAGSVVQQFLSTEPQVWESIQVSREGEPIIVSYSAGRRQDETYRTLDGQPVDPRNQLWLGGGYFERPLQPPGLVEPPLEWSHRIAGLSNQQRPLTSWYLIRDEKPLGSAYFVGYDEVSYLQVGYIGRGGFRRTIPPREEWFDVGRHPLYWWSSPLTSSTNIQYGGRAYANISLRDVENVPTWCAYLIDGDKLWEIDFRARTLKTIFQRSGMLYPSVATEPLPAGDDKERMISRILLRLTDRILVLDPPTGATRDFLLPEKYHDRLMTVYILGEDTLLLVSGRLGFRSGINDLVWLQPEGVIAREVEIALTNPAGVTEETAAWAACGLAPVPIGWLAVLGVGWPLQLLQMNIVGTYSQAAAYTFGRAGVPLLLVIVVGCVLAWATFRIQRRYRRPATGAWTAFVLLFGLPGFIAYWLEHRRPKLENCEDCGELVPRDRDACAACNTPFAAPRLRGTEIFA